ncbi:c-type cytochrome [Robertkochia solimangrovi]|uniref:c-type cytochrome n=1 Tax=Robertkochia solimangrovi TaxID=2213046 RepID=UPI001181496D|nr:cytochrome c [Robertkochia solimangrovi]TRZ46391.1 cytochrome c [Robertkochia solimangrovi]
MRIFSKITIVVSVVGLLAACNSNKSTRNYEFMPNMYESVGYETYQESAAFANGKEGQLPVEGTIPRGFVKYDYENTLDGYAMAKANLNSPLDSLDSEKNLKTGKELFDIYCAVCHGTKGDGQGVLVKREKILGVPRYDDAGRAITVGSVYHVIHYGLNSMGSYANQLNEKERWQVAEYVLKLKQDLQK